MTETEQDLLRKKLEGFQIELKSLQEQSHNLEIETLRVNEATDRLLKKVVELLESCRS